MRRRASFLLLVVVMLIAAVSGCSKQTEKQGAEAQKAITNAAGKTGEYLESEKKDFEKSSEAKLEELQGRLVELRAEADSKGKEFAKAHKAQLDKLAEQIRVERARLEVLKKSGKEAWSDLKDGFDLALKDLEKSFDEAADEFKK